MTRLLVASVFAGTVPNELNRKWYQLQQRMLRDTTPPHEHVACLAKGCGEIADESTVLRPPPDKNKPGPDQAHNYKFLLNHFRERRKEFDAFLLLDSDAFPIAKGWYGRLRKQMKPTGLDLAATARFENLIYHPHPCVGFLLPSALDWVSWHHSPTKDLLNRKFSDVGTGMTGKPFYPLIRTNRVNVHPLLCGIYARMFYHHGAGSRPNSRGWRGQNYHQERHLVDKWRKALFERPKAFIKRLDW